MKARENCSLKGGRDVGPEPCVVYLKGRLFKVVPASHLRTMAQSNTTSQWKNLRNRSFDRGTVRLTYSRINFWPHCCHDIRDQAPASLHPSL